MKRIVTKLKHLLRAILDRKTGADSTQTAGIQISDDPLSLAEVWNLRQAAQKILRYDALKSLDESLDEIVCKHFDKDALEAYVNAREVWDNYFYQSCEHAPEFSAFVNNEGKGLGAFIQTLDDTFSNSFGWIEAYIKSHPDREDTESDVEGLANARHNLEVAKRSAIQIVLESDATSQSKYESLMEIDISHILDPALRDELIVLRDSLDKKRVGKIV